MSIAFELTKAIGKRPCRPGTRAERCPMIINERSEDLLTSSVFGLLKYLSAAIWLVPLLEVAFRDRTFSTIGDIIPKVEFWKKLPSPTGNPQGGIEEVDIVISIRQFVILIECKYRSAVLIPNRKNNGGDQIIRYLDAAVFNYWPDSGGKRDILFLLLTDAPTEPSILSQYREPGKILEGLSESRPFLDYEAISYALAANLGWISWKDLLAILEASVKKGLPRIEAMIVKDLILYLKRKVGKE